MVSGRKEWPELVEQSFHTASRAIRAFDSRLRPYNARNGVENHMYDPFRVSCVTNNNDIVVEVPYYNYQRWY
ncbi:unnamed protein product [Rotaria sp. Silwood1]|nr:unnamed protein product [Rotaria sp. Silwood1]CAF4948095.1 unnamed protein product [Rotaria sp. Silwood1]